MYRVFLVLAITLAFLNINASLSFAAQCTVIYGGGETVCEDTTNTPATAAPTQQPDGATATPTPVAKKPQPTTPPKTKGGLPVEPVSKAKTTPATGPEMLGLVALIPMAGAGIWLRRKTK